MPGIHLRVCLVSAPGVVRNATLAALASIPELKLVAVVSGALSATQMLEHMRTDLLLIDANIPDGEMAALLYWVGDCMPSVRSVVATVTGSQRDQALAFGAAAAIRRDSLTVELPQLISVFSATD